MEKSLDKLVKNLEILSNININDVLNNINKYYSKCENELEQMKYNKKLIINNQIIHNYLINIKIFKMKSNPYFHHFFDSAEKLLNKIKQYNLQEVVHLEPTINFNESIPELKNNNVINNNQQMIVELQKGKVIQAQELKLLNDNQGRALSALECYSNRCSKGDKTNYFDYYNMNNFGYKKDLNQLRGQCIVQTQLFRMAYIDYIKKYGDYKIDNMNTDKLLEILKYWMGKVNDNDKILYKEMIDIISSRKHSSLFSNSFHDYSQKCQNTTMNPREIACIAPGVYNYNHQSIKKAKKNIIETGKIDSKLIIYLSHKDDKNAELLMEQIKNNEEFYKEEKQIIESGFN